MNSNGKIHVIIQKGETNTELYTQDEITSNQSANVNVERPNVQRQAIATALIQAGQQTLSQGLNSYVQLSGNYEIARKLDNFSSVSADVLTIIKGGPIGVIAVGVKYGLDSLNRYVNQVNTNRQINYENQQLGMISREGSRYY